MRPPTSAPARERCRRARPADVSAADCVPTLGCVYLDLRARPGGVRLAPTGALAMMSVLGAVAVRADTLNDGDGYAGSWRR
jgi:hypothetical protein